MTQKTAAIFGHPHPENACLFAQELKDKDFKIQPIRTPFADLKNFDALAPDLLVVMGGLIGVHQADDFPFLHDEIDIIKQRIKADKPTLGICLGAQLIACALGASVHPGSDGPERGWQELTLSKEGKNSPIRHFSNHLTRVFQWHGDTFDFPEGATLLASSNHYPHQAFSYGDNILGLQFHPEVTKQRIQEFEIALIPDLMNSDTPISLQEVRQQTEDYLEVAMGQTKIFFKEWLESIDL